VPQIATQSNYADLQGAFHLVGMQRRHRARDLGGFAVTGSLEGMRSPDDWDDDSDAPPAAMPGLAIY
jgi:hypothetical protein